MIPSAVLIPQVPMTMGVVLSPLICKFGDGCTTFENWTENGSSFFTFDGFSRNETFFEMNWSRCFDTEDV